MPKVPTEVLEEFGRAVKRARALRGWTLDQLASAMAGTSKDVTTRSFLSKIENGKRTIGTVTVGKLIKTLDLEQGWIDRFLDVDVAPEDEVTSEDREAETLIRMAESDAGAPPAAEALMIALAYEFAQGSHVDLMTAYKGLRAALEAAAEIKRRGELPQNTGEQLQAVMRRVAELNDLGQREDAARELDAAMARVRAEVERLDAERAAIFNAQLDQDRILNRPGQAADRLIRYLRDSAPAGGVFNATRHLLRELRERGKTQGSTFDLHVALDLSKQNRERANGPMRSAALSDLGLCHLNLGRMSAEDKHLRVAMKAFQEHAKLLPRRKDPMNWAATQNNLGTALRVLGEREGSTDRLEEAVVAYRAALEERTRDRVPLDWAGTQNNLGNALGSLGDREGSTDRLEEAVVAYRAALEEYTRDRVPLDWAMTQNNLGGALTNLGEREGSTDRLEEAVVAYRAALEEYTRDRVPLDWAGTQNNLGTALRWLGQIKKDPATFDQARAALELAGEVRTRNTVPFQWAEMHWNLGDLALARYGLSPEPSLLAEARQHVLAAREVFAEGAEHHTGRCDELLAKIDALEAGA